MKPTVNSEPTVRCIMIACNLNFDTQLAIGHCSSLGVIGEQLGLGQLPKVKWHSKGGGVGSDLLVAPFKCMSFLHSFQHHFLTYSMFFSYSYLTFWFSIALFRHNGVIDYPT